MQCDDGSHLLLYLLRQQFRNDCQHRNCCCIYLNAFRCNVGRGVDDLLHSLYYTLQMLMNAFLHLLIDLIGVPSYIIGACSGCSFCLSLSFEPAGWLLLMVSVVKLI